MVCFSLSAILQIWCSKGSATTDDGHQFRPLEPPLSEAQEQQKLQRAQEAKRQDEYAAQVLPAQARFGAVPSGGAAVDTSASYLRLIGPQPTLAALQQQEQVTVTTAQPPSFASLMQPPARSAAVRPPPAPAAAPILNQQPTKPNWMQQHTMNVGRPQAKEPLGAPLQPLHALPPPPVLHPPQRSIPETDFIPTKQYQAMQQQQRELVAQQAMRQPMGAGAAIVPRLQMATPAKKPIAAATTAASTAAAAWRALGPSPAKSSAARRKVESVPEVASVLDAYKKKAISPKRRREATTKQEGKKDSLEPEAKRQQLSEDLSPSPILIEPPNAPKLHPSTSTSASDEQPHASSSTDMPHAAAQSIVSSTYSDLIMSDDEDFVSPFIPLPSLPAPPPVLQPIMSQEDADASPLQLQKHPRRAKQRDIFGDDDSEEAKSVSSGSDDEESTPEAKAMTQKSKDEKPKQKLFDIEDEASIDEEGRLSYGQMFRQSSSKTSAATAAAATSRKRKSPEKAQAAGVFSKKDEMAEQLKKRRTEGGGEEKSSSAHSHAAAAGFSKRDTPHEDDEKPWFEDDPKHPFKCFVRVTLKPPSSIVLPIDQTATKKLKSNKQNLTSAAPAAPAATSRPTLSLPAAPSAETFTSMQFKSKEEAIAAKQQFDAARKAAAAMAAAMPAPTAASAAKVSAPLTAPPLVKITAPLKATAGAAAPRIEAPLKPPNSSAHVPANKTSAAPSLPSLPSAKLSATSVASSHLAGPSTAVSLPSPAPSDEFELKEHDVANARTGQLERVFVFVRTKRTWEREGKRLASRDETIEKDQAEALGSAKKRNARGGSSSKAGKAEPKPNATVK
jgi:hypothetical protein